MASKPIDPVIRAQLRCPECLGSLRSDGPDELYCEGCGGPRYECGKVLRFTAAPYVASFGRQWNRYDVARDEEDAAVFRVKTGLDPTAVSGRLVLDAGCGGGRYARLLGRHGAHVVGVDLSSAVDKAASLCAELPNVTILQADLGKLPLAEQVFDLVFSIGVLHHGPDPRGAFAQIARRVRPGGRLAVWLYRRNTRVQEGVNSALRAVTTRVPSRPLEWACAGLGVLGSVPILNRTLNKVANFSNHPDWTLRVCDNFDWYAPPYQSHHTIEELIGWFRAEGFTDIVELTPAKQGRWYDWAYRNNLIVGSGVNVAGTRE
jgi:SAM-dependent methyltransferase